MKEYDDHSGFAFAPPPEEESQATEAPEEARPQEERLITEPETIEELQLYCSQRNLPLEKMRFFIGQDYKEPRAFGIYEDEYGLFVVYKNKADGTRAVRYRGMDQAHAVRELFLKLQEEAGNQRLRSSQARDGIKEYVERGTVQPKKKNVKAILAAGLLAAAIGLGIHQIAVTPDNGYYDYNGQQYYYQSGDWYWYDDTVWLPISPDQELIDDYSDYYLSDYYSPDYGVSDFTYSDFYESDTGSDWDSDSDWSVDDWDSDFTDWSSDW